VSVEALLLWLFAATLAACVLGDLAHLVGWRGPRP
jgi:hypothetical protein